MFATSALSPWPPARGQLAFTTGFGFPLVLAIGKELMKALYIAVALTFSSIIIIIIVVKLLSDKRELDSLHGRIAVGFLIVQDIAVVLAMMAMSALRPSAAAAEALHVLDVVQSLGLRLGADAELTFVVMRYLLPALGEWAGFSKEAGHFWRVFRWRLHRIARP